MLLGVLCGSVAKSFVETTTKDILKRAAESETGWCLHTTSKDVGDGRSMTKISSLSFEYTHAHPHLRNFTHSIVSPNPREQMCSIEISLPVITFPSHISWVLTLQ